MPDSNAILQELQTVNRKLTTVSNYLRLLLIYQVDPGAARLDDNGAEAKGRLQADEEFIRQQFARFEKGAASRQQR